MRTYERVHDYLSKLGLPTLEKSLDSYLETAHHRPVMDILDHLFEQEVKHKLSKKRENMLNRSLGRAMDPSCSGRGL